MAKLTSDLPPSSGQGNDDASRDASEAMRLQRYLARCGVASRRASEALITAGRVSVNGVAVSEQGQKIVPGVDEVCVDGAPVYLEDSHVVLMLNKPAGYVTTMHDEQGRRCVADLLDLQRYPSLYPVGRLDRDAQGLLLFTTDGQLGHALMHPSKHIDKTYHAVVQGVPTAQALQTLKEGVQLEDGMTAPARARILSENRKKNQSVIELVIHEGRNHQVKRMLKTVGHPVIHLKRVALGPLELGDLASGTYRELAPKEVADLRAACGLPAQ